MGKGIIAKSNVVNKIKEAFGEEYIGEYNKKYYVWADDGDERIQIAISLTKPTSPIQVVHSENEDYDFTSDNDSLGASSFEPAELTEEEEIRVQDLMKKLGF